MWCVPLHDSLLLHDGMKQNHTASSGSGDDLKSQRLDSSLTRARSLQKSYDHFRFVFFWAFGNFVQAFTIRRRQPLDAPKRGWWLIDMRVLQYTLCHTHQFCLFQLSLYCALTNGIDWIFDVSEVDSWVVDLDGCAVTVVISSMGIDALLLLRAVWLDIGPQMVQERMENGEWRMAGLWSWTCSCLWYCCRFELQSYVYSVSWCWACAVRQGLDISHLCGWEAVSENVYVYDIGLVLQFIVLYRGSCVSCVDGIAWTACGLLQVIASYL